MPMAFPRRRHRSTEPLTLRAEVRLSAELPALSTPVRLERLHVAVVTGEIDQAAFTRVLRYLAWWDAERTADEALEPAP